MDFMTWTNDLSVSVAVLDDDVALDARTGETRAVATPIGA